MVLCPHGGWQSLDIVQLVPCTSHFDKLSVVASPLLTYGAGEARRCHSSTSLCPRANPSLRSAWRHSAVSRVASSSADLKLDAHKTHASPDICISAKNFYYYEECMTNWTS